MSFEELARNFVIYGHAEVAPSRIDGAVSISNWVGVMTMHTLLTMSDFEELEPESRLSAFRPVHTFKQSPAQILGAFVHRTTIRRIVARGE